MATTKTYTLSLHDALRSDEAIEQLRKTVEMDPGFYYAHWTLGDALRSEEHTSELQSRRELVCRLLLEKKKNGWPLASVRLTIDRIADEVTPRHPLHCKTR